MWESGAVPEEGRGGEGRERDNTGMDGFSLTTIVL